MMRNSELIGRGTRLIRIAADREPRCIPSGAWSLKWLVRFAYTQRCCGSWSRRHWLEAQPRIQTISPSQGRISGGTTVTLTGSGFAGATLTLDGATVTAQSVSDAQIVFVTPAHDNGFASVRPSGNGPTAYAEFLYLPPPLQSVPPGYITTVMGIGFFRGDGRPATNAVVDSSPGYMGVGRDGALYIASSAEPRMRVSTRLVCEHAV